MDTGSAWMLVAADGVRAESEALAAEDIGPESEEVAADDVVDTLLSVDDSDPLLSVAQDSQDPDEVIVVLAVDGMVSDSQEVAADGVARAITSRLHASGVPPARVRPPGQNQRACTPMQKHDDKQNKSGQPVLEPATPCLGTSFRDQSSSICFMLRVHPTPYLIRANMEKLLQINHSMVC
jgi:hypothetical protein